MKSSILLSLLTAGILAAQTAPAPQTQAAPNPGMKSHHRVVSQRGGGQMVARLTRQLNLTADQQNQAKSIFADARTRQQQFAPQLRAEREHMAAAIKSDNEQQIDQITQHSARLNAQARAIHAKAMAKLYTILTPDQKAKLDTMKASRRQMS